MSWSIQSLWLIPALPLLAAAMTALAKRPQRRLAASLAIGSMGVSFLLSCCAFVATLGEHAAPGVERQVQAGMFRKSLRLNRHYSVTQTSQLAFPKGWVKRKQFWLSTRMIPALARLFLLSVRSRA